MPHATELDDRQDELDDENIRQLINPSNPQEVPDIFSRDLELGEKAADAVDYEDLSDDDLAEDLDGHDGAQPLHTPGDATPVPESGDQVRQTNSASAVGYSDNLENDGFDDLFGDMPSSPTEKDREESGGRAVLYEERLGLPLDVVERQEHTQNLERPFLVQKSRELKEEGNRSGLHSTSSKEDTISREQQQQQELFAMSRAGLNVTSVPPAPPENQEELLATLWPKFEKGTVPKFIKLLPPKKARYASKAPPRKPKSLNPNKISLELAADQEKAFKLGSLASKKPQDESDHQMIIVMHRTQGPEEHDDEEFEAESDLEQDLPEGLTWQDLQMICEDWDVLSPASSHGSPRMGHSNAFERGDSENHHISDAPSDWYPMPPTKVPASMNV